MRGIFRICGLLRGGGVPGNRRETPVPGAHVAPVMPVMLADKGGCPGRSGRPAMARGVAPLGNQEAVMRKSRPAWFNVPTVRLPRPDSERV